jgi:hypothetical protein
VRCRDYVNGLQRVEQALERSARTGIRYRNVPDLLVYKAQLLAFKALDTGDDVLFDQAEFLLKQSLEYVEQVGLQGKQEQYGVILANFQNQRGNLGKSLEDLLLEANYKK